MSLARRRHLERGAAGSTSACGRPGAPIKPREDLRRASMIAIYVIAAFIVVIAILNRIEFGRFD